MKSFSKKILLIKGNTAQLFWTLYKKEYHRKPSLMSYCPFFNAFHCLSFAPCERQFHTKLCFDVLCHLFAFRTHASRLGVTVSLKAHLVIFRKLEQCWQGQGRFFICFFPDPFSKAFMYKHNFSNFFLSNLKLPNVQTFLWMPSL